MLNARHGDKVICALEIMNEYNHREYEVERKLRDLSRSNQLTCLSCGQPVYLKAGYIRMPHFAHKDHVSTCTEGQGIYSDEHLAGILYLYNYLHQQLPESELLVDYPFIPNRRANLYLSADKPIAIEYINKPMDYKAWEDKHKDYLEAGLHVLWILNEKYHPLLDQKFYHFFTKTIAEQQGGCVILLDTDKGTFKVVKEVEYKVDGSVYARERYEKIYGVEGFEFKLPYGIDLYKMNDELADWENDFIQQSKRQHAYEKQVAYDKKVRMEKRFSVDKTRQIEKNRRETKEDQALDTHKLKRQLIENSGKDQSTYMEEAFSQMKENPDGPWYDSRGYMSNPWVICKVCGEFTNDIAMKDNHKYGLCRDCASVSPKASQQFRK
jgi:competence CoiA-like predicted nuclease